MADHFGVMAGRLLTESSLQSAIDEASVVPSTTSTACDVSVQDGRPASGVLVECRICQEDDDEACMEAACSCKGSLKQFVPNYTASSKLFQRGRNTIFFSAPGYIQARPMLNADHSATSTNYGYDQTPAPTGVLCCRIIAITLMALLVFRDSLSVFLGDQDAYTVAMVTLLMLRTAAIVIPVYIILVAVTELLHRCRQRQEPLAPATAPAKHLAGVRLDAHGVEVEELTAAKGVTLSDVAERRGKLWLGSVELEYIGLVA
ncbi:unnamed protein product [Miscanthus lutarioriparius]|uniref:RING-CH-type domain-containing protein n=1 Tax=Miscanthus lutarioriparius TaxID=422564 RepID=A0A811S359_9POAL|nr:unnamed protein product [Miscanthus lutarioriparius]